MNTFSKQPSENLDYDFDFADFMPAGDVIASSVVTADAGVTLGSKTDNPGASIVKQFISGGTDGTTYKVTCKITTTGGRVKEAEFKLKVKEL